MIASPNYSQRYGGRPVRIVAIHTAEGARTTASLGAWFANQSVQASSHVGIDDQGIEMYVPYSMAAWAMLSANSIADQAELCGFAAWSRETWLGQHRRMLELAAGWIRERCLARGIPIRKLTPAQVGAGEAGVCGHVDWSIGMRDGDHTDPGPGFPWDVVIALAGGGAATSPTLAAPPPSAHPEDDAMYIKCQLNPGSTTPQIGVAILSGSLFVGLGSQGEKDSAEAAIRAGALQQWVEVDTWRALDRQSHQLHDAPRTVSVTNFPPAAVAPSS